MKFSRAIANKLFWEFMDNSTINGMRTLCFRTTLHHAKKLWLSFLIALIIWTHYVVINLTVRYLEQPTEIRMAPTPVHISKVPFPSVGICSANKFSKRKLDAFAEKVFEVQQSFSPNLLAATPAEMSQHLLILGGLFVYPNDHYTIDDKRLEKLHRIFTVMYVTEDYPTRDILYDLSPDCEKLIVRARIFGREMNASHLIRNRMTTSSMCCMFNYKRPSFSINNKSRFEDDEFLRNAHQVTFESNSELNSVAFVLQSDPEDFTFKELSNDAFQLYIIPPRDYAAIESSKSGEIFINHNTIVEIPILAKFYDSSETIRGVPPEVRKCYFNEEGQQLLNLTYYSIDECLLICRMKSMLRHCGCVKPSMPAPIINANYCNFMDLPCLTKWKRIWFNWDDFYNVVDQKKQSGRTEMRRDIFEGCGHCMPTCDGVSYKIYVNDLPLRSAIGGRTYSSGILKGISDDKPLAIIKLFFQTRYVDTNHSVIVSDWVVLLNRFGGIMSLMYGFSLISIIEIVYFLTGKYFVYFGKKDCEPSAEPAMNMEAQSVTLSTPATPAELYWQELMPTAKVPSYWNAVINRN